MGNMGRGCCMMIDGAYGPAGASALVAGGGESACYHNPIMENLAPGAAADVFMFA
jgi:hypothetical protein